MQTIVKIKEGIRISSSEILEVELFNASTTTYATPKSSLPPSFSTKRILVLDILH